MWDTTTLSTVIMCDCFNADFDLLKTMFKQVDSLSKVRAVQPLLLLAMRASLLRAVGHYRYTVRDAIDVLGNNSCGDCYRNKRRYVTARSALESMKNHGIEAAVCFGGDISRVLLELESHYEERVRPLARTAVNTRPIDYDCGFNYRSPVRNETADGPYVSVETDIDAYNNLLFGARFEAVGGYGSALQWHPAQGPTRCRYNQGMFFGDTTRTSQSVFFAFADSSYTVHLCGHTVYRNDRFIVLTGDVKYEPSTRELRYPDYTREFQDCRLQIVCQNAAVAAHKQNTSVSLAASANVHVTLYGMSVLKIGWIDAEPIRNDDFYCRSNAWSKYRQRFPYNQLSAYLTWHIVMGDGCRIKVRVTSLSGRWPGPGENRKWTLVNTDEHEHFEGNAYILQEYYSYQGEKGTGVIYPFERRTLEEFVAARRRWSLNPSRIIDNLLHARIERPSGTGTPINRVTDRRTSQLIQAMVFRSLVDDDCVESIRYKRLENVSSDGWFSDGECSDSWYSEQ